MNMINEKAEIQNKLTRLIDNRRGRNLKQIEAIESDSHLIYDYLVPPKEMQFFNIGENYGIEMHFKTAPETTKALGFHDNAITQISQKFGVPTKYLRDMATAKEPWKKYLASDILNSHAINADQSRLLVRSVGDQARGVLSDSYMRMNSIILYSTFITAAQKKDAIVIDAHYNGLTGFIEVVNPQVIEIETEENGIQYVCYGMQLKNSDFGMGALDMKAYLFYPVCENGIIRKSAMRKIHRGSQLPDDLQLSQETYKKDTETKVSLMKDVLDNLLNPEKIQDYSLQVVESGKVKIDLEEEVKALPQMGVLDHEVSSLKTIFMENNPHDNVGGGNTLFKLTQGLSAVSRDIGETRKRELDEITGKILDRVN